MNFESLDMHVSIGIEQQPEPIKEAQVARDQSAEFSKPFFNANELGLIAVSAPAAFFVIGMMFRAHRQDKAEALAKSQALPK